MTLQAKYAHTNLIARDWRKLADFYTRVFGCVFLPPERDLSGEILEKGTALPGAHLRGAHLLLPGWSDTGPTLEIFSYDTLAEEGQKAVNRPGFGHIAFVVEDVAQAREQVLANGGSPVGDVVTTMAGQSRRITWCYIADPEGNLLELQSYVDVH
jgi:predicted enzyme related to lactoylglutathione lyase